jgi:hypothetical protein
MNLIERINTLYNNFKTPIQEEEEMINECTAPEEPKKTPMTEQEKQIIDKLYSLLGTKKVLIVNYSEHINFYCFKITDTNYVKIKKQTFLTEDYIYTVSYDEPRIHDVIMKNPSTEAIEHLNIIINSIIDKVAIQKIEAKQEKIDNFLNL